MKSETLELHENAEAKEILNLGENVTHLETLILLARKGGLPYVKEVLEK